jgi:hypothetical protein
VAVVDLEGGITGTGTLAAPLAHTVPLSGGIASAATVFLASGLISIVGAFGQPLFGQMIFGTETEVPLVLELDGEIGAGATFSSTLAVEKPLAGNIAASATLSSTASAQRDLAGGVSGSVVLESAAAITHNMAGGITATGTLASDATLQKHLAGAVVGTGVFGGDPQVVRPAPTLRAVVEVQGVTATVAVAQVSATVEVVSNIKISLAA